MLIAMIDDGIDQSRCPGLHLVHDLIVEESGVVRERMSDEPVLTNHGTTCAQIIQLYAPGTEFCSLCVFSDTKQRTSCNQLVAALGWCAENRVPVIHLSIGSTLLCDYIPLRTAVSRLLSCGQVVVAAHSNDMRKYTMPACLTGVLGVAADPCLSGSGYYVTDEMHSNGIRIYASSHHNLSHYPGGYSITPTANSYAAPVVTAHVSRILENSAPEVKPVAELISTLAGRPVSMSCLHPDFLTEAIVFCPENPCVMKSEFVFEVNGCFEEEAPFWEALRMNSRIPVVLIPPLPHDTLFVKYLIDLSRDRRGILYVGSAPKNWHEKMPCPFWALNTARNFFSSQQPTLSANNNNVPVVQFTPWGSGTVRTMRELKKLFTNYGFCCIALSDSPMACLYGIDYLNPEIPIERALAQIQTSFCPDVILCAFRDGNALFPRDLTAVIGDSHESIADTEIVRLPSHPEYGDILRLYQTLVQE